MSVCDYFKKEDLEDMKNINDNSMFSVFDIRDALNQVNNPLLKCEQIESIFYILNEFKGEREDA